jgi:hypothetical protein
MEKKREGDREAVGEVFLSSDPLYHCFFWYWGWERGAAKVALTMFEKVQKKEEKKLFWTSANRCTTDNLQPIGRTVQG